VFFVSHELEAKLRPIEKKTFPDVKAKVNSFTASK
jgi:hypothetical protein